MPTVQAYKQLKVLADPFSTATLDPKIPDGKAQTSLGVKIQAVNDFTIGEDNVNILLYPGLNSALAVSSIERANNNAGQAQLPGRYIMPIQSGAPFNEDAAATVPTWRQDTSQDASRWRCVSQAVKLTLINNSEDDDGWFEAIRFLPQQDTDLFAHADVIGVHPTINDFKKDNYGAGENMIQHNNYITGKLRDLHKYMFYLQSHQPEREFLPLQDSYSYDPANKETTDWHNAIGQLYDHQMDVVLIRIHGRKTPEGATGCCRGTKIMAHVVTNHEYIYSEDSPMSRLQTRGSAAAGPLQRAITNINRNDGAAVTGGAMAVTPPQPRATQGAAKRKKTGTSQRPRRIA